MIQLARRDARSAHHDYYKQARLNLSKRPRHLDEHLEIPGGIVDARGCFLGALLI